ncbi:DUF927 domain-containing protein [Bradyrhizobium septentrionale]|uniref:DUF927 domain-containing protein n=1 Tax=Bradyrhizobium septentrionale TaxID=1404411 RepID=UPI001596FCF3|nr:DUF927 domain-containing protein [Bradyrhizobium septentrionale]UGY26696.1 DUF927 domain-containing protein [Bradyrhizobium septentrionale]
MKKTATVEDMATRQFYVRAQIRTEDGAKREIIIPRPDCSEPRPLKRKLLDAGAIFPAKAKVKGFLADFMDAESPRQLKRVAQSGWLNGNQTFALQTRVIGQDKSSFIGLPSPPNCDERGWFKSVGTAETWKTRVAPLAISSSSFMLSAAAAFAAPLLDLCKEQSFSICLYGPTRSGKSVATLIGASVVGLGSVRQLPRWHASDSGQEELLPLFNDCLAAIDDFESIRGTESEKYRRIRGFSYGVEAGAEKHRHSSFAPASKTWRTILITSMEKSIDELAKALGEERKGGETIRMVSVPVLIEGHAHIFDRAAADGIAVSPEWTTIWFEKVIKACAENHGEVFIRYLSKLCRDPKKVRSWAKKYIADFVADVSLPEDGDGARDIARKFGLIYAGGRLAVRFKLVPWKRAEVKGAICACYRAARDSLPDEGVALREGVGVLTKLLLSLKPKKEIADYEAAPGYRIKTANGYRYYIRKEKFNMAFHTRAQCELVLKWLVETKRIATSKPRGKNKARGPKQQFGWPGDKRVRSYRIKMPKIDKAT